jgi:hypothetical protein
MKKWLTSLFLLFALANGVLAGTPLHSGDMKMMKCCKKAKSKEQNPQANATRLCCALNCTNTVPAPSGVSFNFSPSGIIVSDSIAKQLASLLLKKEKPATVFMLFERESLSQKSPPKYIQHHSFLI